MPPEVARAYRDPLRLDELFATDVFTDEDRFAVRDELLRRLVGKYGNAEIESGARLTTVTQRVARFKKNPWKSIDLLMSVPEYGGKESVKLELAHIMQPYWAKWWNDFQWLDWDSVLNIEHIVLGDRQLRWLAAQYARSVVDLADPRNRGKYINAVELAEKSSVDPTSVNYSIMNAAREEVYAAAEEARRYGIDDYAAEAMPYVLSYDPLDAAYYTAIYSSTATLERVVSITKQLITPTLITSASRGLR